MKTFSAETDDRQLAKPKGETELSLMGKKIEIPDAWKRGSKQ